jgi:hypothetical protein
MNEDKPVHATGNTESETDTAPLVLGAICMAPLAVAAACLLFLV